MYEDEYYYEARKKENAKLDAELAGTFATVIGGLIGAVLSCLLFLLRRFDVLSSGLASLLFYMLTYTRGIIQGSTAVDASTLATMQSTLEAMELGPLFAIFLQSFIVQFLMYVLSAVIFVIINGRMVEIYLMVSLAPLPFATFGNREQSMMGQNYMRSLFALGFQGFLIMVCVGIYAVLIQSVAFSTDIIASLWKVMGFTILLAFTLFKTGAVAHSIFHAH